MRPLGDGDGHRIALLLRQMRPQHIGHQQQRLRQSAELACELIGRVRQILGQRQAVRVSRRQCVVEMVAIVIAQFDVADRHFRVDVDQRRREVERPLQRLELERAKPPFRVVWLRIGFARHQRKNDRLVKRLHVPEGASQDILRALDIVLTGHSRHRAQVLVGIPDDKGIFCQIWMGCDSRAAHILFVSRIIQGVQLRFHHENA